MTPVSTRIPRRNRPRPLTTQGMPHAQVNVRPVPEIHAELFRRAYQLPGVRNEPTRISVPGARALWLEENLQLAHGELILVGREFAHIHPDGSLHVTLEPQRAVEAIEQGWAEYHPLARQLGIDGMVLIYTPLDEHELEVVFQLILDSYNYITGQNLEPAAIPAAEMNGGK